MMPEWYVLIALLPLISLVRLPGSLLILPIILAGACFAVSLSLAWMRSADPAGRRRPPLMQRARRRLLTMWLFLIQPAARLLGRMLHGLHPWRHHGVCGWAFPRPRELTRWGGPWRSSCDQVCQLETDLRAQGAVVLRSGDFDRWDFEVRGGTLAGARVYHVVEEHGQGRQLSRFLLMPRVSRIARLLLTGGVAIAVAAAVQGIWPMVVVAMAIEVLLLIGLMYEAGVAIGAVAILFARADRMPATGTAVDAPRASELTQVEIESSGDELNLVSAASRIG
jgi:hypothetical protein